MKNQRPGFDSTFPIKLREKIESGWSYKPADRCKLNDFLQVLLQMKNPSSIRQHSPIGETTGVTMLEQANHVQKKLLDYSPIIEMQWATQTDQIKSLIENMVKEMRQSSSFSKIFPDTVINATLQVPKHLFVDMKVFKSITKINDDNQCLAKIYQYKEALRASQEQNISSTEITCTQLSLIPLNSGDRVLFLGAKAGYIQTIAAQTVGFQGQVWICSQDEQGLQHIGNVLKDHVPAILKQIIKCVSVKNVQNASDVKQALEKHIKPAEDYFNVIHVCGAIPQDSLETFQKLLKIEGQLLAPINIDENNQKFTILHKTRDHVTGQIKLNKRILHDWGIIFAPVL
ncbi:unnamed protein product [Adineta ricciae]|uniref:protein-L-isoaspartate(D-aspartate) O-methyltransferase n=1 Tax=Adineta ricciae TaxID=249248 RepID=A0A816GLA8_ADIRI|nr:unnamed protein product [Adineta ricciae]